MLKSFHHLYLKQRFLISAISIFMNPFYLIRRNLFKNIKELAPHLKGNCMDFGCGSKPYESLFNVEKYVGVDIEVSGHQHLGEELNKIDVFYDGKKIPVENETFDSVFCSEVFEHIFNLPEILVEINRVLKKDALVLITVPFVWEEHEIPYDFGRYTSFGIKHLLAENGFETIELRKSGHFMEVIWQLFISYLSDLVKTKNKYINLFINIIFISPFTILGIIISFISPKLNLLYFNNIVLAKKIR
jgi:SAM-dependent methyltransferase